MNIALDLIVKRIVDEAEAVRSFELGRADGAALPPFEAGAHIDVHVPGGPVRQYSLLNDDRERHRYVIAVLREAAGRGGSARMHDAVSVGTVLAVGGPRNAFPLEASSAPVVLMAGGIGVTPLLAMARRLHAQGRPFEFHFATRSLARTPFRAELQSCGFAPQVFFHHDDGPAQQRLDIPRLVADWQPGTQVYLCGPGGFMDAVSAAVRTRTDLVLRTEYFAAPREAAHEGAAFELVLARSGKCMRVPASKGIAEVLREHDIEPGLNCEQGICGTCLTNVISGDIDHRDFYLSPTERAAGTRMLICVSRGKPCTTLTLDL